MSAKQNINKESVARFKSDVVSACPSLVTLKEQRIVSAIPNEIFEDVLREVYGGDNRLARNVMYNRFDKIEFGPPAQEVEDIATMQDATKIVADTIENKSPFLLISDVDDDGSVVQSIGMEVRRLTDVSLSVQPRDYDPGNHGFSISQITSWLDTDGISPSDDFTVMVADLGTNQLDTQTQFLDMFPNAKLLIADHHKADIDMVVKSSYPENEPRTVLVSPFVRGSIRLAIKDGGGVSGGYLTYCIFKNAVQMLRDRNVLEMTDEEFQHRITPMMMMGKAANFYDGVTCDLTLKPLNEMDIKKAIDVSKLTANGRSAGKWINSDQDASVRRLSSLIGDSGVEELLDIRKKMLSQNHMAMALCQVIPDILSGEDNVDIQLKVTKILAEESIYDSAEVNYVERLRPYVLNFSYENQFEGKYKDVWLSLASNCLKGTGGLEKEIIEKLRAHQLVTQVSEDFVVISRPATDAVGSAFTTRQLTKAYQSRVKPLNMSVARAMPHQIVMSYQTDLAISEVLHNVKLEMPNFKISIRGHDKVGGLTLELPNNVDAYQALEMFASLVNREVKQIVSNRSLPKAFEVKPIHLPIVREMLEKMRVHIERAAAPLMVLKVSPNMTFEDKYSLEKQTVAQLVEGKEWETTVEPLDFGMTSSLLIPNQALKAIANDDFGGALGIKLLPNGSYIASDVVTADQIDKIELSQLKTPLQKEREMISDEYKQRFMDLDVPAVTVPRAAGIEALKFTADGKSVYESSEAVLLGVLEELEADSYVVLDVEADGAGNAQCFNVGMAVYSKKKGSGKTLSQSEFDLVSGRSPERIENFREIGDGNYQVNERVSMKLCSLIIGQDGSTPIRISIKSQNLTNMDQDMVDELGITAEEAQDKMLSILDESGKFVVQAHNLPYDNNIARVNFPEVFERMREAIHLDTAPLAKNNLLAYSNVQVNTIDGHEYFNAEHDGYNLSTLMASGEDFDFPSIKGKTVLQVRGQAVQTLDLRNRVTTHLPMERAELALTLLGGMKGMRHPEYGIEKLLKMATIHDMISRQPLKTINKVDFKGYGNVMLSDELWGHFQESYAYDRTPRQNITKFSVLPEVQEFLNGGFVVDSLSEVDPAVLEARGVGAGNAFDPEAKKRSKKDKEAHAEKVNTFGAEDVLYANTIAFLKENPENADRYARTWVYELVLNHHELTRKEAPKGFYQGVSDMTGVSIELVQKIYDDVYKYKQDRGIKTYRVHETHNNVGLEGDVFQEVNVFLHMLKNKLANPYLSGSHAFKHGIKPSTPMIDAMVQQAAESTLKQMIRDATKEILGDDVLNNYSARQLDNFDLDGVSIANERSGVAKMKCKTLSSNDASVHIELPQFDAERYRMMPSDDRKQLEEKVELAVTALLLSNSKGSKKLDSTGRTIVEQAVASPEILETMRYVKKYFGELVPSNREDQVKGLMKSGVDAILGKSPLKMSVNKTLSLADLDIIASTLEKGMERLYDQQGFSSYLTPESLHMSIENAKAEFLAFDHLKKEGEKMTEIVGYEPLSPSAKRELSKLDTSIKGVLDVHHEACADLADNVLNKKTDPLGFMLNSPLVLSIMKDDMKVVQDIEPDVEPKLKR